MKKTNKKTNSSIEIVIEDFSDEVLEELGKYIELGLESIGEKAVGYAQGDCPVDTGLLRNSLTYGLDGGTVKNSSYTDNSGNQHGSYTGQFAAEKQGRALYVGSNVSYALQVETVPATHKVGKAHFLKDAMSNHQEEYKNTLEAVLKLAKW